MRLIFQSDDYGISEAVSFGIIKGIEDGCIRNTGIFINMPNVKESVDLIKDIKDISVGIDINLVAGCPVSDVKQVSHLVDENGHFIKSTVQMKKLKSYSKEGLAVFEEDPYPYDEALLETENQVKRFIELFGRKPSYIHGHSIATMNTYKAQQEVALKYNIPYSVDFMRSPKIKMVHASWNKKPFNILEQVDTDVVHNLINELDKYGDDDIVYFICHAGFVDDDLFKESTYTLIRMKDLSCARSKELKEYIKRRNIKLVSYDEIKEEILNESAF